MRRGKVLFLLGLLMAAAGIWRLVSPGLAGRPASSQVDRLCGASLLFCAALTCMLGVASLHRALRRVVGQIAQVRPGSAVRIEGPHPDLLALGAAINAMADASAQAIADAQVKAKEAQIQLKIVTAERQHLEAIIYSISDAVLVTDRFDEVVLANDSAARLFKFELGAVARAPVEKVLCDDEMVSLIRDMRQSDSRGGRRIVEHRTAGSGGERIYRVTLSCINTANEEPSGVVAVLHDMTREREIAKMKSDFVSNVSHELRTPLASIKAYAEMLIDGEAADEKTAHEFYDVIQNEANRLGRLIDNILSISRIESGVIKVNKQPLSLMVLLKEAVEVIAPQARQKQISIDEQIAPAVYQTLADRDMLYESILNLLSNAVKYTAEGGRITVQSLVDETAQDGHLPDLRHRRGDSAKGPPLYFR